MLSNREHVRYQLGCSDLSCPRRADGVMELPVTRHTVYKSEGLSNNVSGLWTLPRIQAALQARRVPRRRKCLQSSYAGQQYACSLRWTSLACLLSTALQPRAWPLPQILSALPPQVSPICLRQIKGFTLISCNSWICSCMRILEPAHIDVGMSLQVALALRWQRLQQSHSCPAIS